MRVSPHSRQPLLLQRTVTEEMRGQVHAGIEWRSNNEKVARVVDGVVFPVADGETEVIATWKNQAISVPVRVTNQQAAASRSFRNEVLPILAKRDCNTGGCHGALAGKGGFRLSLQGYDPESDYFTIVKQDKGRRIELAAPQYSLLLNKPTTTVPHKGGLKLPRQSEDFEILAQWIAQGATPPSDEDPTVERIEIYIDAALVDGAFAGRRRHRGKRQRRLCHSPRDMGPPARDAARHCAF